MNKDKAYSILLEDQLEQAYNTIEFLHGCLTDPQYKYAYPEQTMQRLEKIASLININNNYCVHSNFVESCDGCKHRIETWDKVQQAKGVYYDNA